MINEDPILKYTTYKSREEMKADEHGELIPFDEPDYGCWNCINYDPGREACTLRWNNLDESYYNPDLDERKPDDSCDAWEHDKDAIWEDFFGWEEY